MEYLHEKKYTVEVRKRGAYKGRGEPPEWRMVQRRDKKYQPQKWREDCWARIFARFRDYDLQGKKGVQESQTEKEEMRQQQTMTDMTRKI